MSNIIEFADHRRRDGYRIVIAPGLWRGFDVIVEPPTSTHPLRHFPTYDEAMACALDVQRTEGWPIFSKYCGPTDGRAA